MTRALSDIRRFTFNGWRIERHDALDSTSEEAKRRALGGDPGRLWIVAETQTAGRGRHGRAWRSPRGNFFGSALLVDPCAISEGAELGFVAGVATQAAVGDFGVAAQLKWPNDLLVDGAKLSGVLLEAWNVGPHYAVAVGVGVNLAEHPPDLPYRATHLAELAGRPVAVREFVERLAVRFDEALALFARGQGFAQVRARWLEGAAGLGRSLRATTAAGVREGLFVGLDARGRLLLRVQDAIETVESADIALLHEAPGGESSS